MKLLRKIFCETPITWKLLIIYSIANGVIVGLLNCVPFLKNTSLVAPAVTYEYWFVAAIFIIANCKRASEAMIKTFVFFLISQPLIYLVEVPFNELGWGLFGYYKFWAIITLFTIPGAWIAYQIKRDNVVSALVLSVATGYLLATGVGSVKQLFSEFPYGLITAIFCFAFAVLLVLVILKKRKSRIIAFICTVAIAAALVIVSIITSNSQTAGYELPSGHEWTVAEAEVDAEIIGNQLTVNSNKKGTYSVVVKNEAGETVKYEFIFGKSITVNTIE